MYVATVPNRSSPPAILLRESYRDRGQVKSRTLANLSHWDPARIEALRRALRGDFDHLASEPTSGPVFALLFALKQLADFLGLTAALGKTRLAKLALGRRSRRRRSARPGLLRRGRSVCRAG